MDTIEALEQRLRVLEDDREALQGRIRVLEDERALRDLIARYSFNADLLDREDKYVDMYTDDGAIDLAEMNKPRFEGKEGIKAFIEQPQARDYCGRSMHHAAPTVFYVDDDDATAEGYSVLYALHEDEAGRDNLASGVIDIPHANFSRWRFRRVNGEWKIVERKVKLLGSPTAGELFTQTVR